MQGDDITLGLTVLILFALMMMMMMMVVVVMSDDGADNFSSYFCPLVSELCQVKVWLVDQLLIIKLSNKSQASIV